MTLDSTLNEPPSPEILDAVNKQVEFVNSRSDEQSTRMYHFMLNAKNVQKGSFTIIINDLYIFYIKLQSKVISLFI